MDNWHSQTGMGTKHLTERYAEYPAQVHEPLLYYAHDPATPAHGHGASSKHGSGGHKSSALSALTLLAFLFFLHILQQCLKEHMTAMTAPQVMVVSAGRQQLLAKTSNDHKRDKAGLADAQTKINKLSDENDAPYTSSDTFMTRIATAQHTPQRTDAYGGYVSAMDQK